MIDDHVAFTRILNLVVASRRPVPWMADDARTNHIEIDVDQALDEVLLGFDRYRMVAILPKRAASAFAIVVALGCAARHQSHCARNGFFIVTRHHQVNVITGDDVIQHAESVAAPGLE